LICGRDKLVPKAYSSAEYRHLADIRSLFEDSNIVGLGIADKTSGGKQVGEMSLRFYVERKKSRKKLKAHKIIPPVISFDGRPVFTDVFQIGRLKAQINRQRSPIVSGFSLGNEQSLGSGTVGAIVTANNKRYILSNAHVLAPGGVDPGDEVEAVYPSVDDSPQDKIQRVGTLRDIVQFTAKGNLADAALAEIHPGFITDLSILGASIPREVADPVKDMVVIGIGRTSGEMQGTILDINYAGKVDMPGPVGEIEFVNQVLCTKYSKDGDSGALMVDSKSGKIIGLHVAGSKGGSMFSPIKNVQAKLKKIKFQFL